MPKYKVEVCALRSLSTVVEVEALDAEDAMEKAEEIALRRNRWSEGGVADGTLEAIRPDEPEDA